MKVNEVKKIVELEKLLGSNLLENSMRKPDEVVMWKENQNWLVGITDERASIVENSIKSFRNEDDACEDYITRLRSLNKIMKLRNMKLRE